MTSYPVWSPLTIDVCPVTKGSSTTSDTGEYSVTIIQCMEDVALSPPCRTLDTRALALIFYVFVGFI